MEITQKDYDLALKSAKMSVLVDLITNVKLKILAVEEGITVMDTHEYVELKIVKRYLEQSLNRLNKGESLVTFN
jgi:hypothetical protein